MSCWYPVSPGSPGWVVAGSDWDEDSITCAWSPSGLKDMSALRELLDRDRPIAIDAPPALSPLLFRARGRRRILLRARGKEDEGGRAFARKHARALARKRSPA